MSPTASSAQIRDAYRAAARVAHPDRIAAAQDSHRSPAETNPAEANMVRINEAYRVLSDPELRAKYDEKLGVGVGAPTGGSTRSSTGASTMEATSPAASKSWVAALLSPPGPARYPYRPVVLAAVVSAVVVLALSSRSHQTERPSTDGVVAPGSCVTIDSNLAAVETPCDPAAKQFRVVAVFPADQACPADTARYRDRQGLGVVCVVKSGERP